MTSLCSQVLLNDYEDLSNFRSPSVKKKPLENKTVSSTTYHAADVMPKWNTNRLIRID